MLFNLNVDPGEDTNLVGSDPQRTTAMLVRLNKYLAALPSPGPAAQPGALDDQTKEALKSLGYLN